MSYLKFYEKERKMFPKEFASKMENEEAKIIFKKLKRHYKIRQEMVFVHSGCNGKCSRWEVIVPIGLNLGLLYHEVAHAVDYDKRKKFKHDKKMMTILKRVFKFARKHNDWKEEVERRTAPKEVKIITKNEIQIQKIEKKKKALVKYEKKLKYYTKLYSNKISKVKRSIMMLERFQDKDLKQAAGQKGD